MDSGITLSTGQIIAVIASGIGIIGTLLKIIQSQYVRHYEEMNTGWQRRFDDTVNAFNKRIDDIQAAHAVTSGRLDERIRWYEERDAQWRQQQTSYIATLEKAVSVQQQQTDAIAALAHRAEPRSRRSGASP